MGNFDVAQLVTSAASGASVPQIADATGLSVSTVTRKLRQPEIEALVRDAALRRVDAWIDGEAGLMAAAVTRLRKLVQEEEPRYALRAIELVLKTSSEYQAQRQLDARLAVLEGHLTADPGSAAAPTGYASAPGDGGEG